MNALENTDAPALFISRTGAAKAGLKLVAKLPRCVRKVRVTGPHGRGDSKGFHLWVIPNGAQGERRRLTERGLQVLNGANDQPKARRSRRG